MTKDEALRMCLEYIETNAHERKYVRHAIKEALAQPAQESDTNEETVTYVADVLEGKKRKQRQWVGLTDEEIEKGRDQAVRWAEAALKEKNT